MQFLQYKDSDIWWHWPVEEGLTVYNINGGWNEIDENSEQFICGREECLDVECAWADKDGTCLIAKVLKQMTDPISALVPEYPVDQNILHGQPNYITHWVHRDTTAKADEGWGGF